MVYKYSVLLLLFCVVTVSYASIIYINPATGSDLNSPCTDPNEPCETFLGAVSSQTENGQDIEIVCSQGSQVTVSLDGTGGGPFTLGTSFYLPATVEAQDGCQAIFNCSSAEHSCFEILLSEGPITFRNILFTGYNPGLIDEGVYSIISASSLSIDYDPKEEKATPGNLILDTCVFKQNTIDIGEAEKGSLGAMVTVFAVSQQLGSIVTIQNTQFDNNIGTAILSSLASVNVLNCEFSSNNGNEFASVFGATIHPFFGGSAITFEGNTVTDCGAEDTPILSFQGQGCLDSSRCNPVSVSDNTFSGTNGRIIEIYDAAPITITGNTVSDLDAEFFVSDENTGTVAPIQISNNQITTATNSDAMIIDANGSVGSYIDNCEFSGGSTQCHLMGNWDVNTCVFQNSKSPAIAITTGQVAVYNSTFSVSTDDSCISVGSVTPYLDSLATLIVVDSAFTASNQAFTVNELSNVYISNSTFTSVSSLVNCAIDSSTIPTNLIYGGLINLVGAANTFPDDMKLSTTDSTGCLFECNANNSQYCDDDDVPILDPSSGNGAVIGLSITLSFVLLYAIVITVVIVAFVGYKFYLKKRDYVSVN